jgi:hypothetical protein
MHPEHAFLHSKPIVHRELSTHLQRIVNFGDRAEFGRRADFVVPHSRRVA